MTIERSIQGISDYVAAYDSSAADERGFPVGFLRMSRQHTVVGTDCLAAAVANASAVGECWTINSGSGGTPTNDTADAENHPGIITLSTGTSTSGRSGFNANGGAEAIRFGAGKGRFGCVLKLPTLSDGTNTYTVRMGWSDSLAGDPTDGVFLRYTNGVNSGKWQLVARSNSVESTQDTGITADTSWHTYEIEVNAAGNSAQAIIDGSNAGSPVTTNIPTGAGRETNIQGPYIVKSAGGTARTISIDAFWFMHEFSTAR
jgi:hypothetical protein